MKICRFDDDRLGIVEGPEVLDVSEALAAIAPRDEIRAGIERIGEFTIRVAPDYAG